MNENAIEATTALDSLLDRVARGEEVVITRNGRAVARLVPSTGAKDPGDAHEALGRLLARAKALGAGSFDWNEWKAYRDEGRS